MAQFPLAFLNETEPFGNVIQSHFPQREIAVVNVHERVLDKRLDSIIVFIKTLGHWLLDFVENLMKTQVLPSALRNLKIGVRSF